MEFYGLFSDYDRGLVMAEQRVRLNNVFHKVMALADGP